MRMPSLNRSNALIFVFIAMAITVGAIHQYFEPRKPLGVSLGFGAFAMALLIFEWYRIDSRERGYRGSLWFSAAVLAASVIALPFYFFRTRGWRGGLIGTALFVLVNAVAWGLQWGAEILVYRLFQAKMS
jgi:hypothetical protein